MGLLVVLPTDRTSRSLRNTGTLVPIYQTVQSHNPRQQSI